MRPTAGAPSMASAAPRRGPLITVAILLLGYAVLSHYGNSSLGARGLGAALSVGPVVLMAALLAWRLTAPLLAASIILGIGALLYYFWPALERHYEWADLVQQGAVYTLIAATFGASLRTGRVPLCTQLAIRLHGTLTAEELAYNRHATLAWGAFYVLLAAAVVVLYFIASLRIWSMFVNFAVFALIALMCVTDHAVRRRVLPRRPGASLITALRQSLIG